MVAGSLTTLGGSVALRKESVDRNPERFCDALKHLWSLSARRAWIEIVDPDSDTLTDDVALRKESVDRNAEDWLNAGSLSRSLSARRAWIEMPTLC